MLAMIIVAMAMAMTTIIVAMAMTMRLSAALPKLFRCFRSTLAYSLRGLAKWITLGIPEDRI